MSNPFTDLVIAVIAAELGVQHMAASRVDDISADHLLDADLNCNSLDRVCICVALDEAFGIEILDDHVEKWTTVQSVIETVELLSVKAVAA